MSETIHRKKLFGGRMTAEEVHSKEAFPPGSKCAGCGTMKGLMTRIIILVPVDELRKRDPVMDILAETKPQEFLQLVVQTKYGPFVRMSTTYACKRCGPSAERTAAKAPSWAIVDIHRGPGVDKIITSGRSAQS